MKRLLLLALVLTLVVSTSVSARTWYIKPNGSRMLCTADCQEPQVADFPTANYYAGIGGVAGENPCPAERTEPTTWGQIKGQFK